MSKSGMLPALLLPLLLLCSSCGTQNSAKIEYQMGEKISLGPFTYNVNHHPTPDSLSRPGAVLLRNDDLWVSDTCNSRVLRFSAH